MSRKTLIINGSPRVHGGAAALLDEWRTAQAMAAVRKLAQWLEGEEQDHTT